MANDYNQGQYRSCGVSQSDHSQCSCVECDSLHCFVRRHNLSNRCKCKECDNSKMCLYYFNNKNNEELEIHNIEHAVRPKDDDLNFVSKCSPKSSITIDDLSLDINERVSDLMKATMEIKESIVTKLSAKEPGTTEALEEKLQYFDKLSNCLTSGGTIKGVAKNEKPINDYLRTEDNYLLKNIEHKSDAYDDSQRTSCQPLLCDHLSDASLKKSNNDENTRELRKMSCCGRNVEAKLRSFISRSTFEENYKRKEATMVNSVEVTYPTRNESVHSTGKLTAQVMNLPYKDFRESVLPNNKVLPCRKPPKLTRVDVLKRIKEAYEACTCKLCECISSIAAPAFKQEICDCAPCNCSDCKKYRMGGHRETTLALISKYVENKPVNCKCKPCECDECKYNYLDRVTLNAVAKEKINAVSKIPACDCKPCDCVECKALGSSKIRTMIVAAVGDDNQRPYCSCSPCGCFECAHPYGTMAQTMAQTHTVTQEMSTGTGTTQHMNCACNPCNHADCEQESANTCNCDRHNKVVSKPVQNGNNDYDIRRVLISNILNANIVQGIASDIQNSQTTFNSLFKTFSRDVMDAGKSNEKTSRNDSMSMYLSDNCVDVKNINKAANMLGFCHCTPCDCQDCKTFNLVEIQPTEECSYQSSNNTYSNSAKSSNQSSFIKEGGIFCDCKPCDCNACQQINNPKNVAAFKKPPRTSIYGSFLSNDYINHLIYEERNTQSVPSSIVLIKESEKRQMPEYNKMLKNTKCFNKISSISSNATVKSFTRMKPKTIITKRDHDIMKNHFLRESTCESTPESSSFKSTPVEFNKNEDPTISYDSSVNNQYDCLRIPGSTAAVVNCIEDVIKLNMNQNLNTSLNVALTNRDRKDIFNPIVCRTITTVQKENEIDSFLVPEFQQNNEIDLSVAKRSAAPVAGNVLHAKLCKKRNKMVPCYCNPCICKSTSSPLFFNTPSKSCQCNCSACECIGVCYNQTVILKKQLTQTPQAFMSTDNDSSEVSDDLEPTYSYTKTFTKNNATRALKQPPQQVHMLSKKESKLPGEIRYMQSYGPYFLDSLPTLGKTDTLFERKINYEKVNKTLSQAKAYSLELLKVLEKYEKANKDFESISHKFKESHGTLLKLEDELLVHKAEQQIKEFKENLESPEDMNKTKNINFEDKKIKQFDILGGIEENKEEDKIIELGKEQSYIEIDNTHSQNHNEYEDECKSQKQCSITLLREIEDDVCPIDFNESIETKETGKEVDITSSFHHLDYICTRNNNINMYRKLVTKAARQCRKQNISKNRMKLIIPSSEKLIRSARPYSKIINEKFKDSQTKIQKQEMISSKHNEIDKRMVSKPITIINEPIMSKLSQSKVLDDNKEMYKSSTNMNVVDPTNNMNPKNGTEINKTGAYKTESNDENVEFINNKISSFQFTNLLNFIKKYSPTLYNEIIKLPQYKSAQVSNESLLVLKDEEEDLTRNLSNELKLNAAETSKYVPKFDPIKARMDVRTKTITELYGEIFRVDKVCTRYSDYQNKIGSNENIEQKIKNTLDNLFSKASVKKLKEYYHTQTVLMKQMCSVKTETIVNVEDSISSLTELIMLDSDLADLERKRNKLAYGSEALSMLKMELNRLLDLPLLTKLINCVHSTSNLIQKEIENKVSRDQTNFRNRQVEPEIGDRSHEGKYKMSDNNFPVDDDVINFVPSIKNTSLIKVSAHHLMDLPRVTCSGNAQSQLSTNRTRKHFNSSGSTFNGHYKCSNQSDSSKIIGSTGSQDVRKIRFSRVTKVSNHSIFVQWNAPKDTKDIQAYELLVDGRSAQMLSPKKCEAVITCLPRNNQIKLTVRPITDGSYLPPTTITYQRSVRNEL